MGVFNIVNLVNRLGYTKKPGICNFSWLFSPRLYPLETYKNQTSIRYDCFTKTFASLLREYFTAFTPLFARKYKRKFLITCGVNKEEKRKEYTKPGVHFDSGEDSAKNLRNVKSFLHSKPVGTRNLLLIVKLAGLEPTLLK